MASLSKTEHTQCYLCNGEKTRKHNTGDMALTVTSQRAEKTGRPGMEIKYSAVKGTKKSLLTTQIRSLYTVLSDQIITVLTVCSVNSNMELVHEHPSVTLALVRRDNVHQHRTITEWLGKTDPCQNLKYGTV